MLHNRFDFTLNKTEIAPLSPIQNNHASAKMGIEELKLNECVVILQKKKKNVRKATESVMLATKQATQG